MKTLLTLQLTIFILVAVGFLMKKIHIIGPQGQKNINDLVIYLMQHPPCIYPECNGWRFQQLSGDSFYLDRYSGILCYLWKSHVPKRI